MTMRGNPRTILRPRRPEAKVCGSPPRVPRTRTPLPPTRQSSRHLSYEWDLREGGGMPGQDDSTRRHTDGGRPAGTAHTDADGDSPETAYDSAQDTARVPRQTGRRRTSASAGRPAAGQTSAAQNAGAQNAGAQNQAARTQAARTQASGRPRRRRRTRRTPTATTSGALASSSRARARTCPPWSATRSRWPRPSSRRAPPRPGRVRDCSEPPRSSPTSRS